MNIIGNTFRNCFQICPVQPNHETNECLENIFEKAINQTTETKSNNNLIELETKVLEAPPDIDSAISETPLKKSSSKEMIEQSENKTQLLSQTINSKEITYYTNVITSLEKLDIPDFELTSTLREYILNECYKESTQFSNDKERWVKDQCIKRLVKQLSEIEEYNIKIFNDHFKELFKNSQNHLKKIILPLLAQAGQNLLNYPLHTFLPRESFIKLSSQQINLIEMESELNNFLDFMNHLNNNINIYINLLEVQKKMCQDFNPAFNLLCLGEVNIKIVNKNLNSIKSFQSNLQVIKDLTEFNVKNENNQFQNEQILEDFKFLKLKTNFLAFFRLENIMNNIFEILDSYASIQNDMIQKFDKAGKTKVGKRKCMLSIPSDEQISIWETYLNNFNRDQIKDKWIYNDFFTKASSKFQQRCDEYQSMREMKSEAEIHRSMCWLMFEKEFNAEAEHSSKEKKKNEINSNKQQKNIPTTIEKNQHLSSNAKVKKNQNLKTDQAVSSQNKMPVLNEQEVILRQHSQLLYDLSNEIKENLNSQCRAAKLNTIDFNEQSAKNHSKELRDHLHFASLNFELFFKAIEQQDFKAMLAILPFLFMDQHLTIEQLLKHQIKIQGLNPAVTHNLLDLYRNSNCKLSNDLEPFIKDFSQAMLQTRYPIAFSHNFSKDSMPGPLKWMIYCQDLTQKLNLGTDVSIDPNEIKDLCTFVFDSYQKTLKCVQNVLNPESKIHLSIAKMFENFAVLKTLLEKTLDVNKDCLVVNQFKNSRSNSMKDSLILENCQGLLDTGNHILKTIKVETSIPEEILEEAANHLLRLDAIDHLQKKYKDLKFAPLHHRNLLTFQWVYEQIYRFIGYAVGIGELRSICNHNLELFHALTFPGESIPKFLKDFNFIRNLHYTSENGNGQSLQMIQKLIKTRKGLKNLDPTDSKWLLGPLDLNDCEKTTKGNQVEIIKNGIELFKSIMCLTKKQFGFEKDV